MPFTCGSIDIEGYKIFKYNEVHHLVRNIVLNDIVFAYEICEQLDPKWRKNLKKFRYNDYDLKVVKFIMSFYDKVDLKQYL